MRTTEQQSVDVAGASPNRSLPEAIKLVRHALAVRAHLAVAGAERKCRDADAIARIWILRILAVDARDRSEAAERRALIAALPDYYAFELTAPAQAMADAVLALDERIHGPDA